MHDPKVVAFTIRRPWPEKTSMRRNTPRWKISRSCFWYLNGQEFHFPSLVTVWHNEPGGADSGTVCKWGSSHWRFHVHHWSLQVHPWQDFKRWAFTRCAWCGGVSRKGDMVNHTLDWETRKPKRFWHGERGVFHLDCSSVQRAHILCYCETPQLSQRDYGQCANCGRHRAWRREPTPADRLLAKLSHGQRIPDQLRPEAFPVEGKTRTVREEQFSTPWREVE